ncbi:UvrD-helicase domain-containing protein [Metamycoplasma alkalescens]|uniref:UvrD-helicase domain-containing protein n=1 Tax=Metamycoplasma alkalescens TaxID=45363 RepID=UPI0003A5A256
MLKRNGINSNQSDAIEMFLKNDIDPGFYDVLLIDEYQDIDSEISNLLEKIKAKNPNIQIIAVGDMDQKIFDKTTLDAKKFINTFLGKYEFICFNKSFRISNVLADFLGRAWKKKIQGLNPECKIEYMELDEISNFLATKQTKDILCLGSRSGHMNSILNFLEENYSEKFNKNTVYASIKDKDGWVSPKEDSAIFTTYDSAKGLERSICVVFDFYEGYWLERLNKPNVKHQIIKNIFLVAASRGKKHIIFVKDQDTRLLREEDFLEETQNSYQSKLYLISEMFDHKYKEDIMDAYECLEIKKINVEDTSIIDIKNNDGLIDLSPCIGIYQESSYFNQYSIDKALEQIIYFNKKYKKIYEEILNNDANNELQKILLYVGIETKQDRYFKQVSLPFITNEQTIQIHNRLGARLNKDERVQELCRIEFYDKINNFSMQAIGLTDVIKNNIVYELKFVNELQYVHYLQLASYMLGLNLKKGILWNVKRNQLFEIRIKNKEDFKKKIALAITKHRFEEKE